MVVIRLARRGAKKRPFYHLTVADRRAKRDGRYLERVGYYNPVAQGDALYLYVNLDRVDFWIGQGAQITDRAASLIKKARKNEMYATPADVATPPSVAVEEATETASVEAPAEDNQVAEDEVVEVAEAATDEATSEEEQAVASEELAEESSEASVEVESESESSDSSSSEEL